MAKSETQRQRDRRRRIAVHLTFLRVEVPMGPLADLLVDACFLPQWNSKDPCAVGKAFSRVVQLSFSPEASQRDAVSEMSLLDRLPR
jgi:hypothetical protein